MTDNEDCTCPWCGDGGFDLPGLKFHVTRGHCDAFNDCEDVKTTLEMIMEQGGA